MRIVAALFAFLVALITTPALAQLTPCTTPGAVQPQSATEAEIQNCVTDRNSLDTIAPTQLGRVLRDISRQDGSPGGGAPIMATSVGMAAGGQDNAPFITSLMSKMGSPSLFSGGYDVTFPAIPGQNWTVYLFNKSLVLSRGAHYHCGGGPTQFGSVILLFAPGVDGVIQEYGTYSPDGGSGLGSIDSCAIVSQGFGNAVAAPGSNSITGVNVFNGDPSGNIPISTFGVGDGIIVVPTTSKFSPDSANIAVSPGAYVGAVAGSTITLGGSYTAAAQLGSASAKFLETSNTSNNFQAGDTLTIGNNTWTFVSSIGATPGNVLVGSSFLNSGVNLANCINGNTTNTTCVAQSVGPNITADIPVAQALVFWAATGGTAGNSLTSTYTPAGTSAGSFGGATFTLGVNTTPVRFYQLPLSQAFTVQTTISSSSVLVTGGPRLLVPGDVIWSDAFPFSTTVYSVSGTLGNQTVVMHTALWSAAQNASVTHTSGSPGTMWVMPAGLKRDVTSVATNNSINYWPIGLEMDCSVGGAGSNCTTSYDSHNFYWDDIVGRWASGDNTASASVAEEGANNFLADIFEGGSVGSSYFSFNSNSAESGNARHSIIQNCVNQNYSSFTGGYVFDAGQGACAASVGLTPTTIGGPLFLGPVEGVPTGVNYIQNGTLFGPWKNTSGLYGNNCIAFGLPNAGSWYSFGFSNAQCSTNTTWGLGWNTTNSDWEWILANSTPVMRFIAGSLGYTGYAGAGGAFPYMGFPDGIQLWNTEGVASAPLNSRLLSFGSATPTGAWHLKGDMQCNTAVVPGGNACWVDTSSFSTTLGGTVTKGTTTSVTVGACPATALPAGTPIDDITSTPPVELGTLSTCTATTLTLQAAAVNNGTNGDTINFMQWEPEGIVQDTIPAISSCGTGTPTVTTNSNNLGGQFTLGTGTPTACTITFAHAYPHAAFCAVSPASSGGAAITGGYYISAQSAAAFTLTIGTGTSSLVFNYNCTGT